MSVQTAMQAAANKNIKLHIGHLLPINTRSISAKVQNGMANGDSVVHTRARESIDNMIDIIIASGGSYTVLENAESQDQWADLTDYLDNTPQEQIYQEGIKLPLDVKIYGNAELNKALIKYYHIADFDGHLKFTIDGKNSFVPSIKVIAENGQSVGSDVIALGNDFYAVDFAVQTNRKYTLVVDRNIATTQGLYNVVLRTIDKIPSFPPTVGPDPDPGFGVDPLPKPVDPTPEALTMHIPVFADGKVGEAYSLTISAQGGVKPYKFIAINSLPLGLTLNEITGEISGIPTDQGGYHFKIKVIDATNAEIISDEIVHIINSQDSLEAENLTINTPSFMDGKVGEAYSLTISAQGGIKPYKFIAINSLPLGLTLNKTTGEISGIPMEEGRYHFKIKVIDAVNTEIISNEIIHTIISQDSLPETLTMHIPPIVDGKVGEAYSLTISAQGGTAPYKFMLAEQNSTRNLRTEVIQSLPSGLSLNETTGEISGIPTTEGNFTFSIKVIDALNNEIISESIRHKIAPLDALNTEIKSIPINAFVSLLLLISIILSLAFMRKQIKPKFRIR